MALTTYICCSQFFYYFCLFKTEKDKLHQMHLNEVRWARGQWNGGAASHQTLVFFQRKNKKNESSGVTYLILRPKKTWAMNDESE